VSPFIIDGRILVATRRSSPKAADQIRDGRYVLHMLPGENDAEFRLRGSAHLLSPGPDRSSLIELGPHYAREEDYLFEYDIEEVATAYWVNVGQPGTYPVRQFWRSPPSAYPPLRARP